MKMLDSDKINAAQVITLLQLNEIDACAPLAIVACPKDAL